MRRSFRISEPPGGEGRLIPDHQRADLTGRPSGPCIWRIAANISPPLATFCVCRVVATVARSVPPV
jgi:hypothetical protein